VYGSNIHQTLDFDNVSMLVTHIRRYVFPRYRPY